MAVDLPGFVGKVGRAGSVCSAQPALYPAGRDRRMSYIINPVRVKGNVVYMTLTHGYEAILDLDSLQIPAIYGWSWYAVITPPKGRKRKPTVRAQRSGSLYKGESSIMANVILGEVPYRQAFYINGNSLDCRKANLRWMTDEEVQAQRKRKND